MNEYGGFIMDEYNSKMGDVVREVLEYFNRNKIDYCILRNYEFLLDESAKQERDIDTLVNNNDLNKIDEILRNHGFLEGKRGCTTNHIGYPKIVLKLVNQEIRIGFDLHVNGLAYNGVFYLSGNDLLARRKRLNIIASRDAFLYVPSDEDYFLELLLHSLLDKGKFSEKYRAILEKMSDCRELDVSYMRNTLSKLFGEKISNRVIGLSLKKQYQDILRLKWTLVLTLCLKNPVNIFTLARNLLRIRRINITNIAKRTFKFLNPSHKAPMICFIGVDGSGKTTIATELSKALNDLGFNAKVFYLGIHKPTRPVRAIKEVYNALQRRKKSKDQKFLSKTKREVASDKSSSFTALKIFLRMVDIYIRYVQVIVARKKGIVAITDRFFYDIMFYDGNIGGRSLSLLLKALPKPDYLFYLYTDTETIHRRGKDNLSTDEIKRRMEKIERFKDLLDYIPVKSEDKEGIIAKIMEKIIVIA